MRLTLTVADPARARRVDVVLDVLPGIPVDEALRPVLGALGLPEDADLSAWVGPDRLDPRDPVGGCLRQGCVVSLGAPVSWERAAPATGGPAAGGLTTAGLTAAGLTAMATGEGTLEVTRPPRLSRPRRQSSFRLPAPPVSGHRRPFPWLLALLPLVGSLGFAWIAGNPRYLLLGLLSPITMLAGAWMDRRGDGRTQRLALADHARRVQAVRAAVEAALLRERSERLADSPDPAEVHETATLPGTRLWERRRYDTDRLLLRLGVADLPAAVVVEDLAADEHERKDSPLLEQVPATVSLPQVGVLGLVDGPLRSADWAVLQAAVLHPPAALQVVVVTETAGAERWAWTRWLPHVVPALGQEAQALVAVGTEAAARRVAELSALVSRRQAEQRTSSPATGGEPDVLLVLSGARRLRSLPGVASVLREGPAVGVYAVCVESDERLLPEECGAVVVEVEDGTLHLAVAGASPVDGILPDLLPDGLPEQVARALAPLRDVGGEDEQGALPGSARLLDVLGLEPPTSAGVRSAWRATGGRSTRAVLGPGLDGEFAVDLRRDGPHALVAGTTGSGKSELLQTLVASLAAGNRPDALTFVLVDYKGGAAFRECADLPHTVGLVTDLDGGLVERALASLRAELTRREHVLAAAGVKDLDDHVAGVAAGRCPGPALARLAIVVDEFAALARELPDFVSGLVDIAQRGRSLGVSLVLATQRPSGAVSPEIRANATLRIALRVSDAAESTDVLDAPDAARIPRTLPGRAYARLGPGAPVPFQAGRVGGERAVAGEALPWAVPATLESLAWPVQAPAAPTSGADGSTDLAALVTAIRAAAAEEGVAAPACPWLPPLPATLLAAEVGSWGLVDLPARQEQRPLPTGLEDLAPLLVVGAGRSGRSTVLRTLAATLAARHGPDDLHLSVLDCGGGALLPLATLPHCGAAVARSDPARAARLLNRLVEEVRRRQRQLAAAGCTSIGEQRERARRTGGEPLAYELVLLDAWEGFLGSLAEVDGGRLLDAVLVLAKEGAAVGVTLVASGDRSLLTGRLAGSVEARLLLRLADPADYSLAGIAPRSMPAGGLAPGRAALVGWSGLAAAPVYAQVALLDADPSGAAQAAALQALSQGLPPLSPARGPLRVDALPDRVDWAQAHALAQAALEQRPRPPGWALVGVGGDRLQALGPDVLEGCGTFVVAGPGRSGRSTLLTAMARWLHGQGVPVAVAAPRGGPLADWSSAAGVPALVGSAPSGAELGGLLTAQSGRPVLLLDDGELLRDAPCRDLLLELVRGAGRGGPAVVAAGEADELCAGFSGWGVELRKARRGVLLSPQGLVDGDLIGVRLPRGLVGQPLDPGRALLHLGDGQLHDVRVPAL